MAEVCRYSNYTYPGYALQFLIEKVASRINQMWAVSIRPQNLELHPEATDGVTVAFDRWLFLN